MEKPICNNCHYYETYCDSAYLGRKIKICRNVTAAIEISGDSKLFSPSPYFDDCQHYKTKEKELV